jgi:acyl carrier protein
LKALSQAVVAEPPALIVHCASPSYRSPIDRLVATNFTSLEVLTRACMPAFLARQSGRIVFLGSLAQRTHARNTKFYAAAKEMTAHLLDGVNFQFNSYGVSAVTLMPDLVRSSFGCGLDSGSGLLLEPEEVAEAIVRSAESSVPGGRYVLDHRGMRCADEGRQASQSTTREDGGTSAKLSSIAHEPDSIAGASLRERLRAIFARMLPISTTLPDAALRLGEVERWDSLGHIKLMIEIERHFSISVATHDISDTTTFEGMLGLIRSQLSTP